MDCTLKKASIDIWRNLATACTTGNGSVGQHVG